MYGEFYQHIFEKHLQVEDVPPNKEITGWARQLIQILFPEQSKQRIAGLYELKEEFTRLEKELCELMNATKACQDCNIEQLANFFFKQLPGLYNTLNTDKRAIFNGDPAARSEFEVVRTYPGFFAISFYRIANCLYKMDIPLIPRILTEYAHSKTGIDIHPAAAIGEYFHIDHGTGIVIGESCTIGNNVKIYQGVTLGAVSVAKSMAFTKRHPTVEDNVVIYSGATILGGETTIGHDSIIGGNVWLTKSVEPYSRVYHKPEVTVFSKSKV